MAKTHTERPTLISAETIIGYGSPNRQNTHKAHGEALGPEETKLAKQTLGIPLEPTFYVPDEALAFFRQAQKRGEDLEAAWEAQFDSYADDYPEEADLLRRLIAGDFGTDFIGSLPEISDKLATRASGGQIINAIAPKLPTLIGGSADLGGSNDTTIKDGAGIFQFDNPGGRTMAYGVREHSMIAAVNGVTLHGACKAYSGTFLVFSDYCRASIRLSAIMEIPSIFVFTHDSVGLGEDGPTHQPVEHLMALRAIPNMNVIRPADGHETAAAWKIAISSKHTPTLLVLTRQGLPSLTPADVKNHPAEKGAYILREGSSTPKCIIVATGSEVSVAVAARDTLEQSGIPTRVVSMPSWFLFGQQSADYRESVLPKGVPTVSVEAGATLGWDRYAQAHVGIDRFGASAPGPIVMEKLGITPEHVVDEAKKLLGS